MSCEIEGIHIHGPFSRKIPRCSIGLSLFVIFSILHVQAYHLRANDDCAFLLLYHRILDGI